MKDRTQKYIQSILPLYFICGTPQCKDLESFLYRACEEGITCFQYREKGKGALENKEKEKLALRLQRICQSFQIPFIVNDDVELAIRLQADGIHVGQGDMPLSQVRKYLPQAIVGTSVNSLEELENTPIHLVDYIGVGPMYGTQTKEDVKEVVGSEFIRLLRKTCSIPMVGIGGITKENWQPVIKSGGDGIATVSAIVKAIDRDEHLGSWRCAIDEALKNR